jgi:GT2 family glycosyltransferase
MWAGGGVRAGVVIPNWNGARWLAGCLDSVAAQTAPPAEVVVVDNGSTDGSAARAAEVPGVRVLELGRNTGFAVAANRGFAALGPDVEAVALLNPDVTLASEWLARTTAALHDDPRAAAVACKMVDMADPGHLYDTGDLLRRDGACEQRGRFTRDDGRYDAPGEVFAACAGAALYRRAAVDEAGGFEERFFLYLEDVELGLRLRLAGWRCRYEPVTARHAGEGSDTVPVRSVEDWVERNTLLLAARHFPARWLPLVAYRQAGWAWHALRAGRLRAHLRAAAGALPLLPAMLRERGALRRGARVPVGAVVPALPLRGFAADRMPFA